MTTAEQIATLARNGSVLTVLKPDGGTLASLLVGELTMLGDRRLFAFEAFGDTGFAGHVLEFASARAPHDLAVEFLRADGSPLTYLTTIEEADCGITRAEWDRWQSMRAASALFIAAVREEITEGSDSRIAAQAAEKRETNS